MQKQFIRNSLYGVAGFAVLTLSNLIFNFMATRLLLSQFGLYSSFFYLILGLSQPVNSLQLSVAKEVSFSNESPERAFSRMFGTFFWIGTFFLLIFLLFSLRIRSIYHLPSVKTVWIGGLILWVMIFLFGIRGIWQGKMNFLIYGSNIGLEGVLRAGLGLGLILSGYGVGGALFASVLSGFLAVTVMLFPLLGQIRLKDIKLKPDLSLLKNFFRAILVFLPFGILMSLDLSIVQWIKGGEWSSYLAACALFGKNLIFLSLILANVVYSYVLKKDGDTFWTGLMITLLMFLGAIVFVLPFGRPMVSLLFAPSFVDKVAKILPLYLLASLPLGLMQQAVNYSVAKDLKTVSVLMWIFLFLEVAVLTFAVNRFSISIVLWILFASLLIMDLVLLILILRFQRKKQGFLNKN